MKISDDVARSDRITAGEPPRILPPRDGICLKHRFRRAAGVAA